MIRPARWTLLALLAACGSGSEGNALPDDAREMRDYVQDGVTLLLPRLGGLGGIFPVALNPGAPGSSDIQFTPDPTPGAPPNSYVFTLGVDGDGNGSKETSFSGSATFNGNPATAWEGFAGSVTLTMTTAGGLGSLTGDLDFVLGATGGEVSGTGTFTEAITGNSTTVTVAPGAPLHIEMARGTSQSVANACASSLDGNIGVSVDGPTGTLNSTWEFKKDRKPARVTGASFTDADNTTTQIPDANVTIPCGQGRAMSTWVGDFVEDWSCVPAEQGTAALTLTVSGSTVNVSDEDPPGSGDVNTYSAAVVSGNPLVVRGFFLGGPPGNTYREDFSWVMDAGGAGFTSISKYVYQEGPNTGNGGFCGSRMTRAP